MANVLGCVSSSFPVSGSFSRSSLNFVSGARTPLSKFVTLSIVLIALGFFTDAFNYIPQAALSAVIFVSINALVNFSEIWEAWKHNKKDCFLMVLTMTVTFVFETQYGLAAGIGCSIVFYLADLAFSRMTAPFVYFSAKDNGNGIDVVRLEGDLSFIQASRVKTFITSLILREPEKPDSSASKSDILFHTISSTFDRLFQPKMMIGVDALPRAIIIDMRRVLITDLTGLVVLKEVMHDIRKLGILCATTNNSIEVQKSLDKFGITNDTASEYVNIQSFLGTFSMDDMDPIPASKQDHTFDEETCEYKNGGIMMEYSHPRLNNFKIHDH